MNSVETKHGTLFWKILPFLSTIDVIVAWSLLLYSFEQQGVAQPDFPYLALYFWIGMVFCITSFSLGFSDTDNYAILISNFLFGLFLLFAWNAAHDDFENAYTLFLENIVILLPLVHLFVLLQMIGSIYRLFR